MIPVWFLDLVVNFSGWCSFTWLLFVFHTPILCTEGKVDEDEKISHFLTLVWYMRRIQPIKRWLWKRLALMREKRNTFPLFFAVEQSIKNFACWLSPGIQKVKYELHGQIVLIFCSLTLFLGSMFKRVFTFLTWCSCWLRFEDFALLFVLGLQLWSTYLSHTIWLFLPLLFSRCLSRHTHTDASLNEPFVYRCTTWKDLSKNKISQCFFWLWRVCAVQLRMFRHKYTFSFPRFGKLNPFLPFELYKALFISVQGFFPSIHSTTPLHRRQWYPNPLCFHRVLFFYVLHRFPSSHPLFSLSASCLPPPPPACSLFGNCRLGACGI